MSVTSGPVQLTSPAALGTFCRIDLGVNPRAQPITSNVLQKSGHSGIAWIASPWYGEFLPTGSWVFTASILEQPLLDAGMVALAANPRGSKG